MENQTNIIEAIRLVVRDELKPIDEKFSLRFNEVLNSNDKIAKELKDMRTEMSFFHIGQKRQDEVLNNHEIRLKTVETRV